VFFLILDPVCSTVNQRILEGEPVPYFRDLFYGEFYDARQQCGREPQLDRRQADDGAVELHQQHGE
jgi:hypothetical protein